MYKLTREEIEIIERTKREGEPGGGGVRVWPLVALALGIVLFAVGVKLFVAWLK